MEDKLFKEAFRKFSLIKIRMKISYQAFSLNMTITELFLKAILTTYFVRGREGNLTTRFKDPFDELLKDLLKG